MTTLIKMIDLQTIFENKPKWSVKDMKTIA